MELNEYAMQSHIVISGYNKSNKEWSQILQCPSGFDGPLELNRFVCPFTVPENITEMQPIFQSGWSSKPDHKAKTRFGKFFVINQPPDWIPVVFDDKLKVQEVSIITLPHHLFPLLVTATCYFLTHTTERFIDMSMVHLWALYMILMLDGVDLLGLDSLEKNGTRYVYVYVTESGGSEDNDDITKNIPPKCNCIYRFELNEDKLINPKAVIKNTSIFEGNAHVGGVIRIDKNDNIFVMIGSLNAKMKIINQI